MLDGLRSSLVTPDLVAAFIAEYQANWNRIQGERYGEVSQRGRQLGSTASIFEAIERGTITPTTKQPVEELEAEKARLEALPVEAAISHPSQPGPPLSRLGGTVGGGTGRPRNCRRGQVGAAVAD